MGTMAARKPVTQAVALPRVAVLMPAYNPGDALNEAVESLVNSTYACDIYIVDDGSDIPVTQILGDFPRTKVIRLDKNSGVPNARNVGLAAILKRPYDFVACLDADDICYPDRIAKQVEFLDRHLEIAVVGAWAGFIDGNDGRKLFVERTPDSGDGTKRVDRHGENAPGLLRSGVPHSEDQRVPRPVMTTLISIWAMALN